MTRVNAAATTCSGPAGMSNRCVARACACSGPSGAGACAAAGVRPTALVAATAAPRTNSRAVPRLRRVARRPRNLIFFMVRMLRRVIVATPPASWRTLARAPGLRRRLIQATEPSQRERDAGPDQDDATGRDQTGDGLSGEPEHFAGVREAHHVPNPASGCQGVERFVGDDVSRPCERQRGPQVGLAAVPAVDGEHHRRARRRRQTKVDGAPVGLLQLGLRQQRGRDRRRTERALPRGPGLPRLRQPRRRGRRRVLPAALHRPSGKRARFPTETKWARRWPRR